MHKLLGMSTNQYWGVLQAACLCSRPMGTTHMRRSHTINSDVCVCVSFPFQVSLPLASCQEGTSRSTVCVTQVRARTGPLVLSFTTKMLFKVNLCHRHQRQPITFIHMIFLIDQLKEFFLYQVIEMALAYTSTTYFCILSCSTSCTNMQARY